MARYIAIVFILLAGIASAQITPETEAYQDDQFISRLYDSLMSGNLKVYTGKKFHEPLSKRIIEGNPYYRSNEWANGTVGYEGQSYSNITMRYHTFLDQLTILKPGWPEAIELPESKVDFFIIHNIKFIRLNEPREGFYGVLYDGNVKMYARYYSSRHEKSIHITELRDRQKYYIKKDGVFTQVKSKKSALKVLIEQRVELRKFLRQQNITFSQNRELALQLLGDEYDRLQKLK